MPLRKFHAIKPEIRVLGIDDGFFTPHSKGLAPLVGVVFRGGYWLDGVLYTAVEVDGLDATSKISSMIVNSSHHKQLRIIMLNGVTYAGFNVVNIKELSENVNVPVVAIVRDKPDFDKIRKALENLPNIEERWEAIQSTRKIYEVMTRRNAKVYVQISGICKEDACRIVQLTSTRSDIPEPLRVAHLIASGISSGTV